MHRILSLLPFALLRPIQKQAKYAKPTEENERPYQQHGGKRALQVFLLRLRLLGLVLRFRTRLHGSLLLSHAVPAAFYAFILSPGMGEVSQGKPLK
jgi:hypothetical protein